MPSSRKVFVVGAARSGTTYLGRAMGLANDTAYFEESSVFSLYGPRRFPEEFAEAVSECPSVQFSPNRMRVLRQTDRLRGKDRLRDAVELMMRNAKVKAYDLRPSNPLVQVQGHQLNEKDRVRARELITKYRAMERNGVRHVLAAYFTDFLELSQKSNLVEKTPGHIAFAPAIQAVFPDARIILIRRKKHDSMVSYLKNFNPRGSLRTRLQSDRMLLRAQCERCLYYEQIEEWLASHEWCHAIEFTDMVEHPLETVENAARWAGLTLDRQKYGHYFKGRPADSKWDRLSTSQQAEIEKLLSAY